jgi:hypothetical protein
MDIVITINTDNDAFSGNPKREIARIVQDFAAHLCNSPGHPLENFNGTALHDFNGNTVGRVEVRPKKQPRAHWHVLSDGRVVSTTQGEEP